MPSNTSVVPRCPGRWSRRARRAAAAGVLALFVTTQARAQAPVPAPTAPPAQPAEVELNIINVPTSLSLKRHGHYFRLTHRFARDLRRGDFGSLVEDLFSLDNGAIIGLEYRFGITSTLQAGVHRSILSKTIQFFGRYDGWKQGGALPVSISLTGSVEGLNNMQDDHQPAIAATISREVAGMLTLHATPAFVANTGADPFTGDEHTAFVGLGGRLRVRPSVFVAGEFTPRVAGHDPGRGTWGIALEKRTGGHSFQINFTNSFGTTFGQLARGGSDHDVYLGFNIVRLF